MLSTDRVVTLCTGSHFKRPNFSLFANSEQNRTARASRFCGSSPGTQLLQRYSVTARKSTNGRLLIRPARLFTSLPRKLAIRVLKLNIAVPCPCPCPSPCPCRATAAAPCHLQPAHLAEVKLLRPGPMTRRTCTCGGGCLNEAGKEGRRLTVWLADVAVSVSGQRRSSPPRPSLAARVYFSI